MSTEAFLVEGSRKLSGEIQPQGAKNEALQIISAVLLTDEDIIIENIPDIVDIRLLIQLIEGLGVKAERLSPSSYKFNASDIDLEYFASDKYQNDAKKIRGSVMLLYHY